MSSKTSLQDFQIERKLGEGAFSIVYKVFRQSDRKEYALKKVKIAQLKTKEKDNALNEIRILASISHPNIIGYKEAFINPDDNTLCIIMEYAGGGDLYQKIVDCKKKKVHIPESIIWRYLIQMSQGLKVLHGMNIVHRDLKCANIFLSGDLNTAKLGDLNVSKIVKNALVYTQTGTPYYASPEVWRDEPYDSKSDIWSLGCVLYECCS
jgi:NIMA (never in mitosis gene a)-related kinase